MNLNKNLFIDKFNGTKEWTTHIFTNIVTYLKYFFIDFVYKSVIQRPHFWLFKRFCLFYLPLSNQWIDTLSVHNLISIEHIHNEHAQDLLRTLKDISNVWCVWDVNDVRYLCPSNMLFWCILNLYSSISLD